LEQMHVWSTTESSQNRVIVPAEILHMICLCLKVITEYVIVVIE